MHPDVLGIGIRLEPGVAGLRKQRALREIAVVVRLGDGRSEIPVDQPAIPDQDHSQPEKSPRRSTCFGHAHEWPPRKSGLALEAERPIITPICPRTA